MLEHDKPITSNGYPIIERDKMYPDETSDGLYRILVKRQPDICAFPNAKNVIAIKYFKNYGYDGWCHALSYDLKLPQAVWMLYGADREDHPLR